MKIERIKLNKIEVDSNQPRKNFNDIEELVASIIKEGLIEPLKVIKEGDKYILMDGERRFRALKLIQKSDKLEDSADCIIIDKPLNTTITQLVTDVHKCKLDPIEEAEAFKKLIESGLEINELKARLAKSREYIIRRLKLLKFSVYIQEKVRNKEIPMSLLDKINIDSIKEKEPIIMQRIVEEGAGVCDVKRIIDEETHRYEYRLNAFYNFLERFKSEVNSITYFLKKELEDSKLEDSKLEDAKKDIDRLIFNFGKLDKIKDESLSIKIKIDNLIEKFGKRHIITKDDLEDE